MTRITQIHDHLRATLRLRMTTSFKEMIYALQRKKKPNQLLWQLHHLVTGAQWAPPKLTPPGEETLEACPDA